jgi:hypothetical protein
LNLRLWWIYSKVPNVIIKLGYIIWGSFKRITILLTIYQCRWRKAQRSIMLNRYSSITVEKA